MERHLSQAYQQLELDNDAKKYVVASTHRRLYAYNWLPFGAAWHFGKKVMEGLLSGLPGGFVYLDDITGQMRVEHLKTLATVLQRLQNTGLKLNGNCVFSASSVEYLGHQMTAEASIPLLKRWKH